MARGGKTLGFTANNGEIIRYEDMADVLAAHGVSFGSTIFVNGASDDHNGSPIDVAALPATLTSFEADYSVSVNCFALWTVHFLNKQPDVTQWGDPVTVRVEGSGTEVGVVAVPSPNTQQRYSASGMKVFNESGAGTWVLDVIGSNWAQGDLQVVGSSLLVVAVPA